MNAEDLLHQCVRAVLATGRRRFGRLIIDDRVFDRRFSHPDWLKSDLIKDYGAQVAGLNFHDNTVGVLPIPTTPGEPPRVKLVPAAPFVHTINRARTGRHDRFILDRKLGGNTLIFAGQVRHKRSTPFEITIDDPPMFFGHLLAGRLKAAGVTVGEVVRPPMDAATDTAAKTRPLYRVRTTLPLVLRRTNHDSQNMFAEALLKRMGHERTSQPGGWSNGAAAVREALRRRLGPEAAAITVADGSGMSRNNRVTSHLLVKLLRSLHEDPVKGPIFQASLAHAGENGTLQDRLEHLKGDVYGKSGYLHGVSALSGYLVLPAAPASADFTTGGGQGEQGEEGAAPHRRVIAFSFLFNGFKPPIYNRQMKRLQNHMVQRIRAALAREQPVRLGG